MLNLKKDKSVWLTSLVWSELIVSYYIIVECHNSSSDDVWLPISQLGSIVVDPVCNWDTISKSAYHALT